METIVVRQGELLEETNHLLDAIDEHREAYRDQISCYYSEQRSRDLQGKAADRAISCFFV